MEEVFSLIYSSLVCKKNVPTNFSSFDRNFLYNNYILVVNDMIKFMFYFGSMDHPETIYLIEKEFVIYYINC